MARRQADHAGGRDLLLRCVQEKQPAASPPITAMSPRSKRPATAKSLSLSTRPAIANCRRSSASSPSCRKHWWEGTDKNGKKRDIGATTLEPPLGSGAYRIKDFSRRPQHRLRARQGLLGQGPQRQRRHATISTSCDSNISATPPSRSKPSRPTPSIGAPRTAPRTGPPPTISRRSATNASSWRNSRSTASASCRPSPSTSAAPKFQDPRVRLRLQLRVRFRGDEQADFLRPVQAHRQLFRRHRACVERLADRARTRIPARPCATRCRRRFSPSPTPTRSAAIRRRCATICARRCGCCKEAGYEMRDQQARQRQDRRTLHASSFSPTTRASSACSCSTSRRSTGSASTVTVRTVDDAQYENRLRNWDFDIITAMLGGIAVARQRAARLLGFAGRRPARLAQPDRHQKSGGRCA